MFNYIAKNNNLDFYTTPGLADGKKSKSNKLWNNKLTNCISCPIRDSPINFDENVKYIIHFRNPLDIMISSYYSFGFTHPLNSSIKEKRKIIKTQTIGEYCLSQENIDEINSKYDKLLNWIEKYKNKENVFISDYDHMYYNFSNWLINIFNFLSLKDSAKTISAFENEFKNCNNEHVKSHINDIKKHNNHHRSGLSKQYLVELKKETQELVISKFSAEIRKHFDFLY